MYTVYNMHYQYQGIVCIFLLSIQVKSLLKGPHLSGWWSQRYLNFSSIEWIKAVLTAQNTLHVKLHHITFVKSPYQPK